MGGVLGLSGSELESFGGVYGALLLVVLLVVVVVVGGKEAPREREARFPLLLEGMGIELGRWWWQGGGYCVRSSKIGRVCGMLVYWRVFFLVWCSGRGSCSDGDHHFTENKESMPQPMCILTPFFYMNDE